MTGRTTLRRARQILSLFIFVLASVLVASAKQESVPDWVRGASSQTLPQYPRETNAVVLLEDTTYSVASDGTATEHYRQVLKILRPQGRDEAVVSVPFDKESKILSLHVWGIGPDGHEYVLNDKEIVEYGYPGQGNFYADLHIKVAKAPGRDPGGIVAYEYEQRVPSYLTEVTWFFQRDLPRLNQSFTLELPAGYSYGTVWAHHESTKEVDLEHRRWRWEMKNTPAINLHHLLLHPSPYALAGRMTIHYGPAGSSASTWKSIGEWYQPLSKDRLGPTPEIAAKAQELVGNKTDFYEKTEAIAEFVQQHIRYFVIEVGIGGYQPHFAGDIFRNRYGDCKDKATLLSAMLSTVGIHSALMMVDHRRGVIDPDAPSIVGDHMIAAIEIPAGYTSPKLHSVVTSKTGRHYLIFDPTWERTAFGQLEHNLQGGYGVLFEGNDSEVIQLPLLEPELNTIRRTASVQLQTDGSVKGSIVEKRFGDVSEARRRIYTTADAKQQEEFLDHLLEEDFTTFKVSDLKVENAEALNKDITMSFAFSADHFSKNMGSLMMFRPRVFGSENLVIDREKRTVPIDLRETMQATDDYEIALPAGYVVDEMPEPVKLDVGFASYQSSSTVKDNILHYSRTYIVREVALPAKKYEDVKKLSELIATDEQNNVVLKKQ